MTTHLTRGPAETEPLPSHHAWCSFDSCLTASVQRGALGVSAVLGLTSLPVLLFCGSAMCSAFKGVNISVFILHLTSIFSI